MSGRRSIPRCRCSEARRAASRWCGGGSRDHQPRHADRQRPRSPAAVHSSRSSSKLGRRPATDSPGVPHNRVRGAMRIAARFGSSSVAGRRPSGAVPTRRAAAMSRLVADVARACASRTPRAARRRPGGAWRSRPRSGRRRRDHGVRWQLPRPTHLGAIGFSRDRRPPRGSAGGGRRTRRSG